MPRPIEHFWRILPAVRRAERGRALFFIGLLALVTAAQTVGLAGSEALFLARLSAQKLPLAFVSAALAAVVGSGIYAIAVGRVRNDSLFAGMLIGWGLLLALVPVASAEPGPFLLFALIAAYYVTQCVLINHFWTFASDYFDTLTSKRLIPVFAIGSSIGGLVGGGFGAFTASALSPIATIGVWGALLLGSAAMMRLARRPLRRWGPLGAEEADETSVEGMAAAVRFVRQSRLGRWLLLASLGMVIAQFIAQYIYSDVFVRTFPDPTSLAVFIAVYLALSNIVEIALVLWGTPWLIRRFGVAGANVVHPGLTLASFAALLVSVRLDTSVAARGVRESVENAVAQPTRALVFNALPARFRGRIRAFLEGVVVYGGMAAAGVLLLALGTPDLRALALLGGGAALAYLAANLGERRAYLDALIEGIRTGRLDLGDLDEEIGDWGSARLADLCDELLRAETMRPSRSLLQLIASLGQHQVAEPLARGLSHPLASVRIACVRALADCHDAQAALRGALTDRDAEVRLAALAALPDDPQADLALLGDPDPRVRAAAAARSPATSDHLVRMLERGDRAERFAALAVAGEDHAERIARAVDDPDPLLGGAALERLAAVAPDRVPEGAIERALDSADPRVRCAALRAWSLRPERAPREQIARALCDPAPEVRSSAADALAASGAAGVEAALPYLGDASTTTAGAALSAIAAGDHPRRRRFLSDELRQRAERAWQSLVALGFFPDREPGARFLRLAIADGGIRELRFAFRALEVLETPRVVRRVERALRYGTARSRGDALEVLSNLGDRDAARLLVLMYEPGPIEERIAGLGPTVALPASRATFLAEARSSEDRWLRMALAAAEPALGETSPPESAVMERLLALKRVPLFENLNLEQLEAVLRLAGDATFLPGEVIVRQGDPGGELFLLLEGSAEAWLDHGGTNPQQLSTMPAGSYFGEMAILDDEPRSATVIAREPARLLTLDGDSLKELLMQMPEIAFELLRVMTSRVRASERRLVAARQGR
jgi:Cyclic nucleotide-binding domain/HEAT repeats